MEQQRTYILVIDKHARTLQLLRQTLVEQQCQASPDRLPQSITLLTAQRLSTGLELLAQQAIHLVFLSLTLADVPGLAALANIQAVYPGLPLVVLTTRRRKALGLQAICRGALDYLVKGNIHCEDILRTVRMALQKQQMQTEMQQIMLERQASEARFHNIIEKNADGILIVDSQGFVRFINPAAENLLSIKAAEFVGELFGFPVVAGERTELDVVLRNGGINVAEMRVVQTEWDGQMAYLASMRDITDRKRIEEDLQRLRHQNELILQSVGEGIYGIDASGKTTFVNPMAVMMLGYTARELIGQPTHLFIHHTLPDGSAYPWHTSPIYRTLRTGEPQAVDDEVFWRKDGSRFPAEYISTPMLERGDIAGVVVTFRDITARKRSEMRRTMQFAVTNVLAHAETLTEAVPRLLKSLCAEVGWHLGEVWLVQPDTHVLVWHGLWHAPDLDIREFEQASRMLAFTQGEGLIGYVWSACQSTWMQDIRSNSTFTRSVAAQALMLQTACAFPILNGNDVIGVIALFSRDQRDRDDELLSVLTGIGSQIGQFMERKRAEEARWRYALRLEVLRKIDRSILAARSTNDIASAAVDHLRQLIQCQQVSVALFDENSHEAIVLVTDIYGETRLMPGERIPFNIAEETVTWTDSDESAEEPVAFSASSPLHEYVQADGMRSSVCVPMASRGSLIGALILSANTENAFSREHVEIAREVANQLAIAVQQAHLFEQVREGRERLQVLSYRLMEAQEAERHHIARELHDEIGQALTAVKISMQALQRVAGEPALEPYIGESISIVDHALQQVRNLSLDLRPSLLDDLGLAAALRWYIDRQTRWAGFTTEFRADLGETRLPSDLETACFRVAQEALTNVIRHAQARRVQVEVWQEQDQLHLVIRDDGIGFDVRLAQKKASHGGSMGLLGMQERVVFAGGNITIDSVPDGGTEVHVNFFLKE
ncbi:MAG: PAS domain S-box protein [Chloroflexaceae bacterium]|nr:PAS domain S-box protein [Chloroflexaceae bacterium]